jgi:hypothetical protein
MNSPTHPFTLPGYITFPEARLRFGGDSERAIDVHSLRGLLSYGPYSSGKLSALSDPIRVAIIAPQGRVRPVVELLREMQQPHHPRERRQYLMDFPGFSKVFGVRLTRALGLATTIELPTSLHQDMERSPKPYMVLAETMSRALATLRNAQHEFDVVMILLGREWETGFSASGDDDFDLHDYIKAVAASLGMCVQIVQETGALNYHCRCSVMWRLSIALYTKAGGIPWVLADMTPGTAYIGIDYALRSTRTGSPASRFAICCSQVFDAEGSGLEFVAYEADVRLFGKNPFLSREQMMKLVSRSLQIYQRKHVGDPPPSRVVIHKNTEFKPYEVDGCFDALINTPNVELVHVQQSCGWRGVQIELPHKPHDYPCHRGTALQIGPYETLLWTQGNLPEMTDNGRNYYKEGKGIPEPLMLVRYAGLGSIDDLCRETLALTKMDWNNDGPYDRLPVTLSFAQILAKVVKRMPTLEHRSYAFRHFM